MNYPFLSQRGRQAVPFPRTAGPRLRQIHWLVLAGAVFAGAALFSYTGDDAQATRTPVSAIAALEIPAAPPGVDTDDRPAAVTQETVATLVPATDLPDRADGPGEAAAATGSSEPPLPEAAGKPDDGSTWTQVTVQTGDSLARIFARAGVNARDLHELMTLGAAVNTLKRIHPGQILHLRADDGGKLLELRYEESQTLGLQVVRGAGGFAATTTHRIPDRQTANATAVIESSLFLAGQKAKLSDSMIMDLAGIFGWDIDFALDIREGDRFTVLYDELYLDGERIGDGNILAAEFVNQGQVFRAIRYTDPDGRTDYYTPEGRSLRKAFLRTPVEFSRISSGFNLKRKHPVLNRIRAHKGVDYAAPKGTPIKVTGSGRVVFRGVKGGYGNVVIVQHGSTYSTLYAHLSGFARGINTGTRVRQGQTIGYLGMTGLATGPHLHYEFLVNGVHRNPLTVKFPDAEPIEKRFRADFQKTAEAMLAQIELVRGQSTQVALSESN